MAAKSRYIRDGWYVVVHHNGKRKKKKAGSKEAAERLARTINERLSADDLGVVVDAGVTLKPFAREWHEHNLKLKTWKHSSTIYYKDKLDNHVIPVLGATAVSAIDHEKVLDLIKAAREKNLSRGTIKGIIATLSAVLTRAVELKLLKANPAFRTGKYLKAGDEMKTNKKTIHPFTRAEVSRLLEAAATVAPEWWLFLLMAVRTGMRLGELLAIRWDDLDLVTGYATIARNFTKGRFTSPKNGEERQVALSPELVDALRQHRRELRKAALKAGKGNELPELVFPGTDGESVADAWTFRKKTWKRIQRKAELKLRRIHDLRHTCASLLLQANVRPDHVKRQLGHKSIQITMDIYGHLMPDDDLRSYVARLDETGTTAATASDGVCPHCAKPLTAAAQ